MIEFSFPVTTDNCLTSLDMRHLYEHNQVISSCRTTVSILVLCREYSGSCLNGPAVGLATYGLFIQVVHFLGKFEIWNQFSKVN